MVTSTLFDVEAITSLRPTGDSLDPNEGDEDTISFNTNRASFGKYIEHHHATTIDEERISFLALWLLRCIFGCKSLKVAKHIWLWLTNYMKDEISVLVN